jgi:hypothetical protein
MADNGQRVRPGSITERVVGYLKGLKPGAEISSCMLARAVGHEGCRISTCLQSPRRNGVLKARKEGKAVFWSLGDTPADNVKPARPRYDKPRVVQGQFKRRLPVSSVWDLAQTG